MKIPIKIILHKVSRNLEVQFVNNETFYLPCAYLRAFSTSAEMRNFDVSAINPHVNILSIEAVGQYAIKPIFSDGHCTGIYSWDTLYELGVNKEKNWCGK
ncbi:MAG: DUF971 domain-containing protein [Gammaproteobacteria bacterium]|nr:DUF971 domain-containing protein [Gammaproteobacteria bacterium]